MKPFFRLISAGQAYAHIDAFTALDSETVNTGRAAGRVLASKVRSPVDVPHFDRSNMDGYAVRAADTFGANDSSSVTLEISAQMSAGQNEAAQLAAGQAVRISTGALMPGGADSVVMVEYTEETRGNEVLIKQPVAPGENTVAAGEDLRTGDLMLEPGRRLTAADLGAIAGVGIARLEVCRRPRVAVLVTGDEIVEAGEALPPGKVRNVNGYSLPALVVDCGADLHSCRVVRDREEEFAGALADAAAACDVVFISGGSSMGTRDLTMASIEGLPGAEVIFHGIAIAPGKPTILARAGTSAIMGLPGNPAAAAVVMSFFGQILVRRLGGEDPGRVRALRPRTRARLAAAIPSMEGRDHYARVRLVENSAGLEARPLLGKSVALSTMAAADGVVIVPAATQGPATGDEVEVLMF